MFISFTMEFEWIERKNKIRIISARPATKEEENGYNNQNDIR